MAYLPPSLSQRRLLTDNVGTPVGGASTLGGSGVAAEPTSGGTAPGAPTTTTPAGGRFSALRGFLDANQPAVDAAAASVAAPIDARAKEAVSLAGESAALPENKGGAEKAADASAARDDALSRIAAASEGVVGDVPTAGITPGAQAADSYLYSRSTPIKDLQAWNPVLQALEPGYGDPYYEPVASDDGAKTDKGKKAQEQYLNSLDDLSGTSHDTKDRGLRYALGFGLPGYGAGINLLTGGKTGRYLDPTSSGGLYDDIGQGTKNVLGGIGDVAQNVGDAVGKTAKKGWDVVKGIF